MILDTHIERSEEGLELLIAAAQSFEENRYIEAIKLKKLSEFEILRLTENVRLWHSRMRKESYNLAAFSENWLEDFATLNNKRFQEAFNLFSKVRSNISNSCKLLKKFCRKVMKNPTNPNVSKCVTDRSMLSAHVVSRDIFGLKSYDENVGILYEEMKGFFHTLVLTLALCHRMIHEEAFIKKDGDRCLEIYRKSREKILSSARMLARTFGIEIKKVSGSELIERRKKAKSSKEFAQKNYHRLNKDEYMTVIAYEVVSEGEKNGITEQESLLWGNNVEWVMKVREAISVIENMVLGKKKISGLLMLEFIKWGRVKKEHEHTLYNYFCKTYKGTTKPVGWTQVFNTQKDLNISDEELAAAFQKELDSLNQNAA